MDERIEKAFATANFMATLSNQRRIILEEFNQSLLYYTNGSTFKITPELISLVQIAINIGRTTDTVFVDSNSLPVVISDVQKFFNDITEFYFKACDDYALKYHNIRTKRRITDIIEL